MKTTNDHIDEGIWEAVTLAVESGYSAETFKEELYAAWHQAMKDKMKADLETLA